MSSSGSSNEDRLSNLPKEVIDEILRYLPLNDAVRTSLLSSRWRYRWMSTPHLVFDQTSITPVPEGSPTSIAVKLMKFLNNFLLLHDGMISEFEIGYFDLRDFDFHFSDIDHLLFLLSKKPLSNLFLDLDLGEFMYELPPCIFSFPMLKSLDVYNCIVNLPRNYKGFAHLTRLGLCYMYLLDQTFELLVAKIPLLHTLEVRDCFNLTRFHINNAPNLVHVRLQGDFDTIKFLYAPKVEILYINICNSLDSSFVRCELDDVIASLDTLRDIEIYYPYIECLPVDIAKETLERSFCHLKDVKLFVEFGDSEQILAVLYLCRTSTFLKMLKIEAVWNRPIKGNNFWKGLVQKEKNILHHLQAVRMIAFKGTKNEMGLMSYILLNAVALETLSIQWDRCKRKHHSLEEMKQFERASPFVKFISSNW